MVLVARGVAVMDAEGRRRVDRNRGDGRQAVQVGLGVPVNVAERGGGYVASVGFDELEAGEQARMREEARKLAGKILFPVVVINEDVIVGWRESELKEALGL